MSGPSGEPPDLASIIKEVNENFAVLYYDALARMEALARMNGHVYLKDDLYLDPIFIRPRLGKTYAVDLFREAMRLDDAPKGLDDAPKVHFVPIPLSPERYIPDQALGWRGGRGGAGIRWLYDGQTKLDAEKHLKEAIGLENQLFGKKPLAESYPTSKKKLYRPPKAKSKTGKPVLLHQPKQRSPPVRYTPFYNKN